MPISQRTQLARAPHECVSLSQARNHNYLTCASLANDSNQLTHLNSNSNPTLGDLLDFDEFTVEKTFMLGEFDDGDGLLIEVDLPQGIIGDAYP